MGKPFDRIRKSLGLPVRIPGAAYTEEWWGDVPAAVPSLQEIRLESAGLNVSALEPAAPAAAPPWEPAESEEDWDALILAAKEREPTDRVFLPPVVEQPKPRKAFPAPARAVSQIRSEPVGGEWEAAIARAKAGTIAAARIEEQAQKEEDWTGIIRLAKANAV